MTKQERLTILASEAVAGYWGHPNFQPPTQSQLACAIMDDILEINRKIEEECAPKPLEDRLTIRDAAQERQALNGSDAQALEGALAQVERELSAEKAKNEISLRELSRLNNVLVKELGSPPTVTESVYDTAIRLLREYHTLRTLFLSLRAPQNPQR